MQIETFRISSYIPASEAFHFARKGLARRWPARAHDHDFHEVFLITEGHTEHWVNGVTQVLGEGHLAFVRPGDAHAFRADRRVGCRIVNVMFRSETAAHLAGRYADTVAGRFFDSDAALPEAHLLDPARFERALTVAGQLQVTDRSLARIEEFLLTLVNRVASDQSHAVRDGPAWFARACMAAQAPAVFRAGAAGFIAAAGRSHEHVCRTCRDVLGITPTEFVNRIRVDHAAHLLRSEDTAIENVALACGFANTSYFYRLFQRAYDTTPRRYRARHHRDPFR
ncbi:AraC family transcriptional regulator [uncultured Jannaschia sp.]|uniref:helix-turn-helix transcriptional regulator n=1 Tax=uncultured Jannaschia sp. TaxID=293347 RepID=UPI00262866B0|nr:AraC family transcriptional regulator [uncultured Jannaschia sp.]